MKFVPAEVNIGCMKLNNVDHLGSVSFGSTVKINRNVSAKKTQAFGQQQADFTFRFANIQMVLDDEPLDAGTVKVNI